MDAIGISLKALVHVMNLFLIAFVIFILAGVSIYQQSFQRRCVLPQGICCHACTSGPHLPKDQPRRGGHVPVPAVPPAPLRAAARCGISAAMSCMVQ